MGGQLGEHGVGQHLAGAVVAGGAQVVRRGLDPGQDGVENLQALRHHLGADAVAGNHRDPCHRHVEPPAPFTSTER